MRRVALLRRGLCSWTQKYTALSESWDKFSDPSSRSSTRSEYAPARPQANDVFPNSHLKLGEIDAYGFDYDYTIATYNSRLKSKIFDMGVESLVENSGYPEGLLDLVGTYDDGFMIRGLHFDKRTGFLLKLDQFGQIQLDAVFLGKYQLSTDKVKEAYNQHTRISKEYSKQNLIMLSDLFSLPTAALLAYVNQYFVDLGARFHPLNLYYDVIREIDELHNTQKLHRIITNNISDYLDPAPDIGPFLHRLRKGGKKTFLLSNSRYKFIDIGMQHLLNDFVSKHEEYDTWRDLFDVVMVQAHKPQWFTGSASFRQRDLTTNSLSVHPVQSLHKGEVYSYGNMADFHLMLNVPGHRILYIGDHLFADIYRPQSMAMWKTAAIMPEVVKDVSIMNTHEFEALLSKQLHIEQLIESAQMLGVEKQTSELRELIRHMKNQRNEFRATLKSMINPHFGSPFRSYSERTMFFFNVCRMADAYTSRISNFSKYPLDYSFNVRRSSYPHEPYI